MKSRKKTAKPSASPTAPPVQESSSQLVLIGLFLIVATVLAYSQVRNFDFLNYDDNLYITDNLYLKAGLTLRGLKWAFTDLSSAHWHPLTWLSLMLDDQICGLNAGCFHLTNLFFHVVNTLLLFMILSRMTGARWRSGFVAALFALHPLHVESVVWITERKDVLSTFFGFLTVTAYIRYAERSRRATYCLALFFFALALMSKSMFVTLPFVLLLLDYWPLRRMQSTKTFFSVLVREKIPFFLLAGVSSAVAIIASKSGIALKGFDDFSLWDRVANTPVAYVRYMARMIWPQDLNPFYPYTRDLPFWEVAGSCLLLAGISVFTVRSMKKMPWLLVGWFWFLGTMLPVIGLIQVGDQSLADRYTYLPLIGLFIAISWSIPTTLSSNHFLSRHYRAFIFTTSVALISILASLTWLQTSYWKNSTTLFERVLQLTPDSVLAHYNLSSALIDDGKFDEGVAHLHEMLRIMPNSTDALLNLGKAFGNAGRPVEAGEWFAKVVMVDPSIAEAQNLWGVALRDQGKIEDAVFHYKEAVRIKPDYVEAQYNLAQALQGKGKYEDSGFESSHLDLGVALGKQGKFAEAIEQFTQVLKFNPKSAAAHSDMGIVFASQGKLVDAVAHFQEATRIQPDLVDPHMNLGSAYALLGNKNGALEEYKALEKLNPEMARELYRRIAPR